VLLSTEAREAPRLETHGSGVMKTSGAKCKNLSFTVMCNANLTTSGLETMWCVLTGHILAITFGVLFAVTLLVFSMYTYRQQKKYSKYVHSRLIHHLLI